MQYSVNLYNYLIQHHKFFLNQLAGDTLAEKLQHPDNFMQLLYSIETSFIHDLITALSDEYMIKSFKNLMTLKYKMNECAISSDKQKAVLSHPVSEKLQKLNPSYVTQLVHFVRQDVKSAFVDALNYEGMDRLIKRC